MDGMFVDGDFPTGKPCPYHCSPTCHPGQVDENEWHFGCLHKAWPQNRYGDFCPFVKCDGDLAKCEIPAKLLKRMKAGQNRRIANAKNKIAEAEKEIAKIDRLLSASGRP